MDGITFLRELIRDFPFDFIIAAPIRDIVNNTIIGTSISTGLAISPNYKPFIKA
jgi:hypothetical protein